MNQNKIVSLILLSRLRAQHFLLFFLIATVPSAPLVAAIEPEAFTSATFAQAQITAATEGKVVFVDFFTTWCPPCKLLDSTTWKDEKVVALLHDKTVAVRVDAEKEPELAKKYHIDAYPTLLVLKPDGTEVDRYVGYLAADPFRETLTATLAGKTSLQVARDSVKAEDGATPRAKMELARKLAQAGQSAEALELYLWCYDSGPDADPQFSTVLNTALPGMIGSLGRSYPPAIAALHTRRDTLQQKVMTDPKTAEVESVTRLAALDVALKDDATIIATLAKLPADGRARKVYGGMPVLMHLVEKKQYQAALSLGVPEAGYDKQVDRTNNTLEVMRTSGRPLPEQMLANIKKSSSMIGMVYVIALAGAGETERAHKLGDRVIAATDDPTVRNSLQNGLREAGLNDFAAYFAQEEKSADKSP